MADSWEGCQSKDPQLASAWSLNRVLCCFYPWWKVEEVGIVEEGTCVRMRRRARLSLKQSALVIANLLSQQLQ